MSLLLDTTELDPGDLVWAPDGQHVFYPHANLVEAGYRPESFLHVPIGEEVYELQGRIGHTCPWPVGGFWWVEPVVENEETA